MGISDYELQTGDRGRESDKGQQVNHDSPLGFISCLVKDLSLSSRGAPGES
jgi:hypothetical protein